MSQHEPTMLQCVALKCYDRLAKAVWLFYYNDDFKYCFHLGGEGKCFKQELKFIEKLHCHSCSNYLQHHRISNCCFNPKHHMVVCFFIGPAVKVFLMLNKTRLGRKRTAMQKKTLNPVYNEAFTFKVTSDTLQKVTFKILVVNKHSHGSDQTIGHVLLGQQVTGSGFSHWNHMLASLRKPIAMWHPIVPGA